MILLAAEPLLASEVKKISMAQMPAGLFFVLNIFLLAVCSEATHAQVNTGRLKTVVITESAVSSITLAGLNYLWYRKFPHSRFHFFDDSAEWLNMDKMGHATTAYNVSAVQYDLMRWSGMKNRQAIWVGGLTAMGFQTIIEIFDGFSDKWGFSVSDMLANLTGTTLFMAQQFAFNDQRVQLKFSFHRTIYAGYNPSELGKNIWQRWLKDYNGQTYWLSVNPASFMKANTPFPRWLDVSFGYGGEGMIGGTKNPAVINDVSIPSFKRYRQYYFSLDANWNQVGNNTASERLLQALPGIIKIPFPAIEYSNAEPLKLHLFYF